MFYKRSQVAYVSVEDAARILRVSRWTLYRNMHEVPHVMVGTEYRIPVEWLFMEPPKVRLGRTECAAPRFYDQPALFDVAPVRTWRNSGKPVMLDPYGDAVKSTIY